MANEGSLSLNLSFNKGGAQFNARPRVITPSFDVAGNYPIQQIFTIGSTDTVIDLENVGTPGYVFFHNLDNASDVTFGSNGTSYPGKLRKGGGGYALYEHNGAAIHMIASPGGADVECLILPA